MTESETATGAGAHAPLRVAQVVATAGATGVESYLLTLMSAFDPARVTATLFVPRPGVLVERMQARGLSVEMGAPTRKLAFAEADALAQRWRGRFDVVHAHGPRAAFWAHRAARRAGIRPFVATVHELRWQTLPPGIKREAWIALEARVLARASRLVTVSDATRRDLIARMPHLADRTETVYASTPWLLEPERLPRARPAEGRDGPLRLATVARLNWQKGYDLLLPALATVRDRGLDFTLDIVGAGVLEKSMRELARRLGIADRLRWLGSAADVPSVLAAAQAFVTTTRSEMFGIAVLEAMAMGLPVVAPAVGSLPEVVADGVTGTLVPFEPESTLPLRVADVLTRWAASPELRASLGAAGVVRASEVFGPARLAAGIAAVYERALAGG